MTTLDVASHIALLQPIRHCIGFYVPNVKGLIGFNTYWTVGGPSACSVHASDWCGVGGRGLVPRPRRPLATETVFNGAAEDRHIGRSEPRGKCGKVRGQSIPGRRSSRKCRQGLSISFPCCPHLGRTEAGDAPGTDTARVMPPASANRTVAAPAEYPCSGSGRPPSSSRGSPRTTPNRHAKVTPQQGGFLGDGQRVAAGFSGRGAVGFFGVGAFAVGRPAGRPMICS